MMKSVFISVVLICACLSCLQAQDDQNPCASLQPYHIVVLGSSTAAGTGPSTPDSAWVNRFRLYQEGIHPGNQVTNLAIGGTTTYHIMPTGFVPPVNRPNPNPSNNVSQAISLQADAIIVNMPSNDAANNFTVAEQMSNFNTIATTAANAGIPVWVCTTQPRNSFGVAQNAIQTQVRDLVLQTFGNRAIDFWNPFANNNLDIDPLYDSGDGVHLNDPAHRLLFQKVRAEAILGHLFDTASTTDLAIVDFVQVDGHACGDSLALWQGIATNLGPSSNSDLYVDVEVFDLPTNTASFYPDTLFGGIGTCEADTFWLTLNTYAGADLALQAVLANANDPNPQNDTSIQLNYQVPGFPQLSSINDTVCLGDPAVLQASSNDLNDTIFWYNAASGGAILQGGEAFPLGAIAAPEERYAAAVRGPLFYSEALETVSNTTTNWNGIMFDVVAHVPLTIDSLRLRINSTGPQSVVAFTKVGTHIGAQNNAVAWQVWGSDLVNVVAAGDFKVVQFPELVLQQGDTLGVYLYMQQSNATLSYRWSASPGVFSNSELSVLSGTGVSHTFTNLYYPRHWAGEVFYHHGFAETGTCASPRTLVSAAVSQPVISLGNDTSIYASDTLVLQASTGFASYFWQTGSTTDSLLVDANTFGLGPSIFWVEGTDPFGCTARDTIEVTILADTLVDGLAERQQLGDFTLFPNPSQGSFQLQFKSGESRTIQLYDSIGNRLLEVQNSTDRWTNPQELTAGSYSLSILEGETQYWRKVIVY